MDDRSASGSVLLTLPIEIRQLIYEHLMVNRSEKLNKSVLRMSHHFLVIDPDFFCVCKQINTEATRIVDTTNKPFFATSIIQGTLAQLRSGSSIPSRQLDQIRHLNLVASIFDFTDNLKADLAFLHKRDCHFETLTITVPIFIRKPTVDDTQRVLDTIEMLTLTEEIVVFIHPTDDDGPHYRCGAMPLAQELRARGGTWREEYPVAKHLANHWDPMRLTFSVEPEEAVALRVRAGNEFHWQRWVLDKGAAAREKVEGVAVGMGGMDLSGG